MKAKTFLVLILLILSVCAKASDIKVEVKNGGNGLSVKDALVTARNSSLDTISGLLPAVFDESTGSYNLKDLPGSVSFIMVNYKDKYIFVEPLRDKITVTIPAEAFYSEIAEVTVEGESRYMTDEKTVYIPTKREKNAAHGGVDLIEFIGIPTLSISEGKISTISGDEVKMFVDYIPATSQDLASIRTQDVLKVETYENPADPRFMGARYAVNYIMQQYEYGGYTKFNLFEVTPTVSSTTGVNSKMVYKKMTYDLYGNYDYSHNPHTGSSSTNIYGFEDGQIKRESTDPSGTSIQSIGNFNFRAIYKGKQAQIINSAGFMIGRNPQYTRNYEFYTPEIYTDSKSSSTTKSRNRAGNWRGDYQIYLPNNFMLMVNPKASYATNTRLYDYESAGEDIFYDISERTWDLGITLMIDKRVKWGHNFFLSQYAGIQRNIIDYRGVNPSNVNAANGGTSTEIGGNFKFGRFTISPRVGIIYNYSKYNTSFLKEILPRWYINIRYLINSKNNIRLYSEWANYALPLTQRSPNIVYTNLLEGVTGNPELKLNPLKDVGVQYTAIPNNKVSFSMYGEFNHYSEALAYIYTESEREGKPVMIQNIVNDGYMVQINYGFNINLKLLKNSLRLSAGLSGKSYRREGEYVDFSRTLLSWNISANYFIKDFRIMASYRSMNKNMSITGIYNRAPQNYYIGAGWSKNSLNISLYFYNMFNSSWDNKYASLYLKNYERNTITYGRTYHRRAILQLTYSFSYGKKTNKGNEIGNISDISSGIVTGAD